MPGYAYNLPAIHCKTGSKLAAIPGPTCHGCYALKGRYRFPNVMDAMMRRLRSITRPDWARTMAADINARRSRFFRWHDSGDVQSVKHLLKIFHVCRLRLTWRTGFPHGRPGSFLRSRRTGCQLT